jgi:hypothetical protein
MLTTQEKIVLIKVLRRERLKLFASKEHKRLVSSALAKLEQSLRNIKVNKLDKPTYL